jgi:hypothetical protein
MTVGKVMVGGCAVVAELFAVAAAAGVMAVGEVEAWGLEAEVVEAGVLEAGIEEVADVEVAATGAASCDRAAGAAHSASAALTDRASGEGRKRRAVLLDAARERMDIVFLKLNRGLAGRLRRSDREKSLLVRGVARMRGVLRRSDGKQR